MKRWHFAAVPLAAISLLFGACGGDGDSSSTATPGGDASGSPSAPTGTPLSDEDYLHVFCTGISRYREALNTASREELVNVVEDYRDSMAEVVPPADVQEFHTAFVDYLTEAMEEPTALITEDPPVPEASVRERLAEKQSSVDACEYPTFLGAETS
jgi:hypothetical protein